MSPPRRCASPTQIWNDVLTTAPQSVSTPENAAVTAPGARRHHPGYGRWTPFFFLAPAVIALFAIGIYPTVFAIVTSFRRYNITRRADMLDGFPFVGLDNYREAFNDQTFWDSLTLTGKFFLCVVPLQIVLGVLIA